nr:DUF3093 domain-containing protein [Tessaracoccus sp. OS52]
MRVPWWWWFVALLAVGSLAVALFAYLTVPLATAVVVLFAFAVGAVAYSYGNAAVSVSGDRLSVGRFSVEGKWIRGAEALQGDAAVAALGPEADTRDFLQTRPYVRDLVRVDLADPADPHPHWLVSSRNPDELASAIRAIAGGGRP